MTGFIFYYYASMKNVTTKSFRFQSLISNNQHGNPSVCLLYMLLNMSLNQKYAIIIK